MSYLSGTRTNGGVEVLHGVLVDVTVVDAVLFTGIDVSAIKTVAMSLADSGISGTAAVMLEVSVDGINWTDVGAGLTAGQGTRDVESYPLARVTVSTADGSASEMQLSLWGLPRLS